MDFSKIESGLLHIENLDFSLAATLREMSEIFFPRAKEKGLAFALDIAPGVPDIFHGDSLRLSQILINLLSNAIKFTPAGGVSLRVFPETQSGRIITLHFVVKDTGIGVAEDKIASLFLPFTQGDGSNTRLYGGMGLGLAISRNLVNLMHGDIWCVSGVGMGAEFHFTAQFETDVPVPTAATVPQGGGGLVSHAFFAGRRVLLAEDNLINQMVAVEILSAGGIAVDVAANGQEALDLLANNYYDAVLLDIQMPVMDGLEAARKIRKNPRFNSLPVIAMTAHAMPGDRERSLEAGMNEHLTKPIVPEELAETLAKYFKPL
jgi:two-component system sensor histidine kinase/response regulator